LCGGQPGDDICEASRLRERRDLARDVEDPQDARYWTSPPANFLKRGPVADS
jgi:hypothetical protein